MDLNEIAVFIRVVQAGSFSRAAKQLNMPNSTVSVKVSSLEKRLGATLIRRTTRKLQVTDIGEAYYRRCLEGVDEILDAEKEIFQGQGEPQGVLRVTAAIEFGSIVLPEFIAEFSRKYPKVHVELVLSNHTMDLVSEGIDLALRAGDLKDSSLLSRRLGSGYLIPIAGSGYLKKMGTPKKPEELSQHHCLQFGRMGETRWRMESKKGKANVRIVPKAAVNDFTALKSLAAMNEGVALVPSFLCLPEIKSGKLVRILPEWRSDQKQMHFVYAPQKFVSPKIERFIETVGPLMKQRLADFEV